MKTATITTACEQGEQGYKVSGQIAAPGLLVANNPGYDAERMSCDSKISIFHIPSGLTFGTVRSKKRAIEVCFEVSKLMAWDVDRQTLFDRRREMTIAARLMRQIDCKRSAADLIAEIAASYDEGARVAAAVEENAKARRKASAAASRARRVKLHNPQTV